jgi:hypothetical protein
MNPQKYVCSPLFGVDPKMAALAGSKYKLERSFPDKPVPVAFRIYAGLKLFPFPLL